MRFQTFGKTKKPIVIFIQGGLTSWRLLQPSIDILSEKYFLIVPILDGHDSEVASTFTTIQKASTDIANHVTTNYGKHVHGVIGFSLGGTIATEIINKELLFADNVILDSAFLAPMKPAISSIAVRFMTAQVHRMQRGKKSLYPVLPPNIQVLDNISHESTHNLFAECFKYRATALSSNHSLHIIYYYGSREAGFGKRSYEQLLKLYPNAQRKIFPNYAHGELILNHQSQFASEVISFFGAKDSLRGQTL